MKGFLLCALALSIIAVSTCLCLLILSTRQTVELIPVEMDYTRVALVQRLDKLQVDALNEIDSQANGIRKDMRKDVAMIAGKADAQLTGIADKADTQMNGIRKDLKESVAMAVAPITEMRADLKPLLVSSTRLVDNYAALPGQLSTELRPSWLAIQPEITCRQADGSGYGGCWHSRLTGLMGEALSVGGTFTKHFPSLVTSFDGIGVDTHKFTTKFTAPTSTRTKIWEGFRGVGAIASHF